MATTAKRLGRTAGARIVAPFILGLLILAAWQMVALGKLVPTFFLPSPEVFLSTLWDGISKETLLNHAVITLMESVGGCILGSAVALPLGYFVARFRLVASALEPFIAASQAVPAVAVAPLLALWIGYGYVPIVTLCAMLVFFPLLVNTTLGFTTIDRDIIDAARIDAASGWSMLRYIEYPLALPAILAGLRTGFTLSVTGSVVGEFVIGGNGLGQLLVDQRNFANSSGEFATLFILAVLAIIFHGTVRIVERSVARKVR